MYKSLMPFIGIIAGEPVQFMTGDTISAANATELGLAIKPDLAEKITTGAADAKTA